MNYMPEMLNERKVKIAITAVLNAIADADGDEAEGIRTVIAAMRKDRDIADGLAMVAYRHVAEQTSGDRDGVEAGHRRIADAALREMSTSTPTNSGAEGRPSFSSDGGLTNSAHASLPERGEEGHRRPVPQSTIVDLSSSPLLPSKNTGGAGHAERAPERQALRARPPVPFRKPSSIELLAARKVENAAANSIFRTFMVRGRSIGSYTFGELKHTEYQSRIEAAVCRRIHRHAPMTYKDALVSAVIDEKQLKKFIDDATKEIDDAA